MEINKKADLARAKESIRETVYYGLSDLVSRVFQLLKKEGELNAGEIQVIRTSTQLLKFCIPAVKAKDDEDNVYNESYNQVGSMGESRVADGQNMEVKKSDNFGEKL